MNNRIILYITMFIKLIKRCLITGSVSYVLHRSVNNQDTITLIQSSAKIYLLFKEFFDFQRISIFGRGIVRLSKMIGHVQIISFSNVTSSSFGCLSGYFDAENGESVAARKFFLTEQFTRGQRRSQTQFFGTGRIPGVAIRIHNSFTSDVRAVPYYFLRPNI